MEELNRIDFVLKYQKDLLHAVQHMPAFEFSILIDAIDDAERVFVLGNGGSAATASHLASDLNKETGLNTVISLTDNVPVITATANDYGYKFVFQKQLEAYRVGKGDLVICISVSGTSKNLIYAAAYADKQGARIIGLVSEKCVLSSAITLARLSNNLLIIESNDYGIVEDTHSIICHMLARYFKNRFLKNQ
jgi:D-sedoheptulose 7-phosphate isomerase